MNHRRSFHAVLARLSLLIATVSYLTVTVVGPLAHLAYVRAEATRVAQAPSTPGKHDQAPKHDESHCLLCHSLESIAAPSTGTSVPLAELRPAPAPPEPAGPAADSALPLAQARAPPLFA